MWTTSEDEIIRPLTQPQREAPLGASTGGVDAGLLLRMMDEVDHGMLVIDAYCQLRHANHLGRHALTNSRFIACHGQMLMGSKTEHTQKIDQALKHALKGHRQLITLKDGENELALAFVPLSHALESESPCVLVMLSRQSACENLAVRMYARAHHLSPSEEMVLIALCKGHTIPEIAKENGVALSTVRTQIKALRAKTGCSSIRMILLRVHSLPPVMSALRSITPMAHNAMAFV
jgi:DNA-binding NarL/FixJ family response regulator